jgi:hypothetical protein
VRAVVVVVRAVHAKQVLWVPSAEDEPAVEALAPDGAHPAFRVRVCVRRLHRLADDLDPFAAEDRVEPAAELAVAIVDQQPERPLTLVERHQQVARLLFHPPALGVARYGDVLDPAPLERDEEQHVEPLQPERLDREEITSKDPVGLLTEELPPAEAVALRRRRQPGCGKDRAD